MSTYRELVYIILDQIRATSDDSLYNDAHISYLIDKYRSMLLKQKYSDVRKRIPSSNTQTVKISFEQKNDDLGLSTNELISTSYIPQMVSIGALDSSVSISSAGNDLNGIHMSFVPYERIRFVGNDQFLNKIIYFSLDKNNKLIAKSNGNAIQYLKSVNLTAVFDNPREAFLFNKDKNGFDMLDIEFPLEDSLQSTLIEVIVERLLRSSRLNSDEVNNASDDLNKK